MGCMTAIIRFIALTMNKIPSHNIDIAIMCHSIESYTYSIDWDWGRFEEMIHNFLEIIHFFELLNRSIFSQLTDISLSIPLWCIGNNQRIYISLNTEGSDE